MKFTRWFARGLQRISRVRSGTVVRRMASFSGMSLTAESLETRAVLTAPNFTSVADWDSPENNTLAALVEANDPDNDPLTFSLPGTGADAALFVIDPQTGDLSFNFGPNFEFPADADGDNIFEVDVEVTDFIDQPVTQSIRITVTDIDDETPFINSADQVSVDEGIQFVQVATAIDADAASVVTLSLTGNGADDALFTIDPVTGVVEFAIVTDFANPVDANQDNVYEFEVNATDGIQSAQQIVRVTVNQVAANPVIAFNDGPVTFKKGQAAIAVAANFTATGNNIGGGVLVISVNNVNTGKKRADVFNVGSLAAIGAVDTVLTNGRWVSTVTLDPNADAGDVQAAVRGVTFFTSKKGLKFTTRNVKVQLLNSLFNASNEITKTINVRKK